MTGAAVELDGPSGVQSNKESWKWWVSEVRLQPAGGQGECGYDGIRASDGRIFGTGRWGPLLRLAWASETPPLIQLVSS